MTMETPIGKVKTQRNWLDPSIYILGQTKRGDDGKVKYGKTKER